MSKFAGLNVPITKTRMTILHPLSGDPLVRNDTKEECWIELSPSQSQAGVLVDRAIHDAMMKRRGPRMTGADAEKNALTRLAGLTSGWSLALLDGTPLDVAYDPEAALELYSDNVWLRDQVAIFVADLGNFQAKS